MIFRVTFAFVQYIVDPNMMTDKNKGAQAIIKKVIIVIVLLGRQGICLKLLLIFRIKF